jgi:predicted HicB family RNase H-like nuclease
VNGRKLTKTSSFFTHELHEFSRMPYLDWCKQRGKEPGKPFSGEFILRFSPELRRELNLKAKLANTSLNSFIVHTSEKAAVI